MAKKLKLYNGRGYDKGTHFYIAAYSAIDAARMLVKKYPYTKISYWQKEIKIYFSQCWGKRMQSIEPKRGIWLDTSKFSPDSKIICILNEN